LYFLEVENTLNFIEGEYMNKTRSTAIAKAVSWLISIISLVYLKYFIEYESLFLNVFIIGIFTSIILNILVGQWKIIYEDLVYSERYMRTYLSLYRDGYINKNEKIKISFKRLFRINIDGKYLLAKKDTYKKFQPIESLLLLDDKFMEKFFKKYAISKDEIHTSDKPQLKIRVPAKNFHKIVNKLLKEYKISDKLNRDAYSSFINLFSKISKIDIKTLKSFTKHIKHDGRLITDLEFLRGDQEYKLTIYDIYDIPLDKNTIKKYKHLEIENIVFATRDEILKLGTDHINKQYVETITSHAYKILEDQKVNYIK
jgi:hypothetical protein